MMVQHGRRPVKTEPIEMKLLHPIADIGQQKLLYFPLAVVEKLGIPSSVIAPVSRMEVLMLAAIKLVEALIYILHRVRMHDIHDDGYVHSVSGIDERLELLGSAETGSGCEVVGDVVAEGAVVGVLHHGHKLDSIVAAGLDAWKDQLLKLSVCAHLLFFQRHSDMRFIDQRHCRSFVK